MPPLSAFRVQDFRCFAEATCELAEGATLFVGDNAQGKTSLLEAVCVLLRLQSPRASDPAELVRFGQSRFGLSGDFGNSRLQYLFRDGKRSLSRDGVPVARAAEYLSHGGLIVWMGTDDLQMVRGGGEHRRRFLDFLGSQAFAEYRPALLAYERALRARNRLLKEPRPDRRQIEAYTRLLVPQGECLVRLRARLVGDLGPVAGEAHRQVSERNELVTLSYAPSAAGDFAGELDAARAEEERRRMTVIGPHRDDVAISLDGVEAARFASEGQQRTLAIALKLAQARWLAEIRGDDPLMLIDDIFGELDPARRNALLRALPVGSQQLITSTSLRWIDDSFQAGRIFRVEAGSVFIER